MLQKRREIKPGRPTKYSSAVARKICKAVADGCSREAAAALAGISASTLHEWRNQFSEFSDALEKADARFEAECVASIRKAGRSKRNWTACAWFLERKLPQRYGKVDRHLIRNESHGAPLPQAYIEAINRALGFTGKLVPIGDHGNQLLPDTKHNGGSNTRELAMLPQHEDVIDIEVLPQD